MSVKETLNMANAIVMLKEAKDLNKLSKQLEAGCDNTDIADQIIREKKRLHDVGVFDHEEFWAETGKYTRGRLK